MIATEKEMSYRFRIQHATAKWVDAAWKVMLKFMSI